MDSRPSTFIILHLELIIMSQRGRSYLAHAHTHIGSLLIADCGFVFAPCQPVTFLVLFIEPTTAHTHGGQQKGTAGAADVTRKLHSGKPPPILNL